MSDLWLPLLFAFVILGIIALSAWLALTLAKRGHTAGREGGEVESARAVKGAPPLLCLYRDEHGLWVVEVEGRLYGDLTEVEPIALRVEVLEGIRFLAAFSKREMEHRRAGKEQEKPRPVVPPPPPPASSIKPKLDLVYGDRPQAKRSRRATMRPSRPPQLLPTIDLAKEIGEIVEVMQARYPTLRDRTIRLQNAAEGGVLFIVDGVRYEAVEAIPDAEVRTLIRAATRAWEERID